MSEQQASHVMAKHPPPVSTGITVPIVGSSAESSAKVPGDFEWHELGALCAALQAEQIHLVGAGAGDMDFCSTTPMTREYSRWALQSSLKTAELWEAYSLTLPAY